MPEPQTPSPPPPSPGGVHISRGVTPRIPAGGLVIHMNAAGSPMGVARLELQLDTCIHWFEIALENLAQAKSGQAALLQLKADGATDFGTLLDREFKASVQASVAAATFFEALYAATVERMPTRPTPPGPNRRQRQARYAKVAEQLRQAFGLKKQGTANLRSVLSEVYRFRDEAVHPSAKFSEPILHPELQVGVERRFVMFGYASARQLVRAALAFSKTLASRDLTRKQKAIQDFASYLLKVCKPLYPQWEQAHGALFDKPPSAT
jgi:hypothetical protein